MTIETPRYDIATVQLFYYSTIRPRSEIKSRYVLPEDARCLFARSVQPLSQSFIHLCIFLRPGYNDDQIIVALTPHVNYNVCSVTISFYNYFFILFWFIHVWVRLVFFFLSFFFKHLTDIQSYLRIYNIINSIADWITLQSFV